MQITFINAIERWAHAIAPVGIGRRAQRSPGSSLVHVPDIPPKTLKDAPARIDPMIEGQQVLDAPWIFDKDEHEGVHFVRPVTLRE